jgi:hypothetical protein
MVAVAENLPGSDGGRSCAICGPRRAIVSF